MVLAGALAAAGCVEIEGGLDDGRAELVTGTPDAVGVVRFLNAPTTTFELLDREVPLDRRAAQNLIAARPFADVDEVDAVPYVGATALDRLVAYARAHGFVPGEDELLGSFDGVPFTVAEATRALRLVNEESDGVLLREVELDARAVRSILDARPIRSMAELSELYYVGPAMLRRIRDYVATPSQPVDCRSNADCAPELRCVGRPADGSSDHGMCRDLRGIAGEGAYCNDAIACEQGLFCSGISLWGEGECRPEWMRTSLRSSTQRAIPQETTVPVATSVIVRGLATVPVDLAVDIELGHSDPHSLRIALRDPNGAEALLWDGASSPGPFPGSFPVGGEISRDDAVNGRWMLRIWNPGGVGTGTLRGWTLDVSSRWD